MHRGELRYLAAAIAGGHRAIVPSEHVDDWSALARKAIPRLKPLRRRSLDLVYRLVGQSWESATPPLTLLSGDESFEALFGHKKQRNPGMLALGAFGLLVVRGSLWDDSVLGDLRKCLDYGGNSFSYGGDFTRQPSFVLVGRGVPDASAWKLGAEIQLRGAPSRTADANKLAEAARVGRTRLDTDWYVLPAGHDRDAVSARIARSLAAVDGASRVTRDHLDEADAIVFRFRSEETSACESAH